MSSNYILKEDWLDMITIHGVFGQGTVDGLKKAVLDNMDKDMGGLLIAESSSDGNFIDLEYRKKVRDLGQKNKEFIMGFICQEKMSGEDFLYFTPGVHLDKKDDEMGQRYRSVEEALVRDDCDVVIVGRGIYQANNPGETAKKYSEEGWQSMLKK